MLLTCDCDNYRGSRCLGRRDGLREETAVFGIYEYRAAAIVMTASSSVDVIPHRKEKVSRKGEKEHQATKHINRDI